VGARTGTNMTLPTEFVIGVSGLRWAHILWAYRRQLLGWRVGELISALAEREPAAEEKCRDRWAYLSLLWLHRNRESVEDVFAAIDAIFADFNYPARMYPFVSIMPLDSGYDPTAHTLEVNRNRMLENWIAYLQSEGPRLGLA
jgi:hypothetical protein